MATTSIFDKKNVLYEISASNTLPFSFNDTAFPLNSGDTPPQYADYYNNATQKLFENDLYLEQLILNIENSENIPGAEIVSLQNENRVLNSLEGKKFAITSHIEPYVVLGHKTQSELRNSLSTVDFFEGQKINFAYYDERKYIVGTISGLYCSDNLLTGWHPVGRDDLLLQSFSTFECICFTANPLYAVDSEATKDLMKYQYFMGTNGGVFAFVAYDVYEPYWIKLHHDFSLPVVKLVVDSQSSRLYIGTKNGLYFSNGKTISPVNKSKNKRINDIAVLEDTELLKKDQNVLVATDYGIYQTMPGYYLSGINEICTIDSGGKLLKISYAKYKEPLDTDDDDDVDNELEEQIIEDIGARDNSGELSGNYYTATSKRIIKINPKNKRAENEIVFDLATSNISDIAGITDFTVAADPIKDTVFITNGKKIWRVLEKTSAEEIEININDSSIDDDNAIKFVDFHDQNYIFCYVTNKNIYSVSHKGTSTIVFGQLKDSDENTITGEIKNICKFSDENVYCINVNDKTLYKLEFKNSSGTAVTYETKYLTSLIQFDNKTTFKDYKYAGTYNSCGYYIAEAYPSRKIVLIKIPFPVNHNIANSSATVLPVAVPDGITDGNVITMNSHKNISVKIYTKNSNSRVLIIYTNGDTSKLYKLDYDNIVNNAILLKEISITAGGGSAEAISTPVDTYACGLFKSKDKKTQYLAVYGKVDTENGTKTYKLYQIDNFDADTKLDYNNDDAVVVHEITSSSITNFLTTHKITDFVFTEPGRTMLCFATAEGKGTNAGKKLLVKMNIFESFFADDIIDISTAGNTYALTYEKFESLSSILSTSKIKELDIYDSAPAILGTSGGKTFANIDGISSNINDANTVLQLPYPLLAYNSNNSQTRLDNAWITGIQEDGIKIFDINSAIHDDPANYADHYFTAAEPTDGNFRNCTHLFGGLENQEPGCNRGKFFIALTNGSTSAQIRSYHASMYEISSAMLGDISTLHIKDGTMIISGGLIKIPDLLQDEKTIGYTDILSGAKIIDAFGKLPIVDFLPATVITKNNGTVSLYSLNEEYANNDIQDLPNIAYQTGSEISSITLQSHFIKLLTNEPNATMLNTYDEDVTTRDNFGNIFYIGKYSSDDAISAAVHKIYATGAAKLKTVQVAFPAVTDQGSTFPNKPEIYTASYYDISANYLCANITATTDFEISTKHVDTLYAKLKSPDLNYLLSAYIANTASTPIQYTDSININIGFNDWHKTTSHPFRLSIDFKNPGGELPSISAGVLSLEISAKTGSNKFSCFTVPISTYLVDYINPETRETDYSDFTIENIPENIPEFANVFIERDSDPSASASASAESLSISILSSETDAQCIAELSGGSDFLWWGDIYQPHIEFSIKSTEDNSWYISCTADLSSNISKNYFANKKVSEIETILNQNNFPINITESAVNTDKCYDTYAVTGSFKGLRKKTENLYTTLDATKELSTFNAADLVYLYELTFNFIPRAEIDSLTSEHSVSSFGEQIESVNFKNINSKRYFSTILSSGCLDLENGKYFPVKNSLQYCKRPDELSGAVYFLVDEIGENPLNQPIALSAYKLYKTCMREETTTMDAPERVILQLDENERNADISEFAIENLPADNTSELIDFLVERDQDTPSTSASDDITTPVKILAPNTGVLYILGKNGNVYYIRNHNTSKVHFSGLSGVSDIAMTSRYSDSSFLMAKTGETWKVLLENTGLLYEGTDEPRITLQKLADLDIKCDIQNDLYINSADNIYAAITKPDENEPGVAMSLLDTMIDFTTNSSEEFAGKCKIAINKQSTAKALKKSQIFTLTENGNDLVISYYSYNEIGNLDEYKCYGNDYGRLTNTKLSDVAIFEAFSEAAVFSETINGKTIVYGGWLVVKTSAQNAGLWNWYIDTENNAHFDMCIVDAYVRDRLIADVSNFAGFQAGWTDKHLRNAAVLMNNKTGVYRLKEGTTIETFSNAMSTPMPNGAMLANVWQFPMLIGNGSTFTLSSLYETETKNIKITQLSSTNDGKTVNLRSINDVSKNALSADNNYKFVRIDTNQINSSSKITYNTRNDDADVNSNFKEAFANKWNPVSYFAATENDFAFLIQNKNSDAETGICRKDELEKYENANTRCVLIVNAGDILSNIVRTDDRSTHPDNVDVYAAGMLKNSNKLVISFGLSADNFKYCCLSTETDAVQIPSPCREIASNNFGVFCNAQTGVYCYNNIANELGIASFPDIRLQSGEYTDFLNPHGFVCPDGNDILFITGKTAFTLKSAGMAPELTHISEKYSILRDKFPSQKINVLYRIDDENFIVGTDEYGKYVKRLNMALIPKDFDNLSSSPLSGKPVNTIIKVTKPYENTVKTKYIYSFGNTIYSSENNIELFREIKEVGKTNTKINDVYSQDGESYCICTDNGLYVAYSGYSIENDLKKYDVAHIKETQRDQLALKLTDHRSKFHNPTDTQLSSLYAFNQALAAKCPAKLNSVPAGFTSDNFLGIFNETRIIKNDVVETIEFDDSNHYIRASIKNWAVGQMTSQSIYSDNGYVDRITDPIDSTDIDMSKIPYVFKKWNSGLKEFDIHVPTTMTYYINNPKGFSRSLYANGMVIRKNVAGKPATSNVISEKCTSLRILLDNNHFGIKNIYAVQIAGNSLPLRIYKDSEYCQEGRENLFDTIMQPSVLNSIFGADNSKATVSNVDSLLDASNNLVLEFSIYGTDAQSIKILAE